MKTSFISSLAMQNSMRSTILKAQLEMTNLNTELTTGKHADLGVTLGANTARSLDLNRDVDRLSSLVSVNSIATQRLKSSQAALDGMAKAAQEIQKVLVPNTNSEAPTLATVAKTISNAFNTFTGFANTAVSGEFLFSGINTDVKPVDDYFAQGSTLKAAYEVELNAFMAAQTPPVGNIAALSKDQAAAFMTRIEGVFSGTTTGYEPAAQRSDGRPELRLLDDLWVEGERHEHDEPHQPERGCRDIDQQQLAGDALFRDDGHDCDDVP
ncbi:MAG: hypothetical protein U5L46_12270 [Agrobacterium sp.]|nr:hypothetical protein [Agrobacterium sp.]